MGFRRSRYRHIGVDIDSLADPAFRFESIICVVRPCTNLLEKVRTDQAPGVEKSGDHTAIGFVRVDRHMDEIHPIAQLQEVIDAAKAG
jgi:hypothetical protein